MAGPGLQQVQRLSLQQILAPQLQQSLHLLQVSTLELQSLVHEELQQNPLLEDMPKDEPRVEVERTSSIADDPSGPTRKVRPLVLHACSHLPTFPRFLRQVQSIDVSTTALFEAN